MDNKKPKGIIALDLDGTLLDSGKKLSERNRLALELAAQEGLLVVPTTGRFFGMMPQAVRDLPFVRYAITINGAQVYDRETDTAIVRAEIPLEMALDLMRLLDKYDVIYDCYRSNWGWMTQAMQEKAEAYATDGHYLKMIRDFRNPVSDLKTHLFDTRQEGDVQKVMLFAPNGPGAEEILDGIRKDVASAFPQIKVTSSTWNNIELNIESANKGSSLKRFAEHLGLGLEDCISFGDGLNDLSMIKAAGTGVAVANAHPDVLAAADAVTESNDDDGVAVFLEEMLDRAQVRR